MKKRKKREKKREEEKEGMCRCGQRLDLDVHSKDY
jgi:hypothetical protein